MSNALFVPGGADTAPTSLNGAVMYSDGGCRPNPGVGGWGIHGYIYSIDTPKKGLGLAGIVATADGYLAKTAAKENELVTLLQYVDGYGSLFPMTTNNVAELTGAIEAVTEIIKMYHSHSVDRAVVYSDSKYVIDGITKWVPGWISRGWTKGNGEEIKNEDVWRALHSEVERAIAIGINLRWGWVRGHSGDTGNEATDILATQGVIVGNKNIKKDDVWYSEAQGYWNDSTEYNRMLSLPKWYFNTHVLEEAKSADGRFAYYIGHHGKDDDLAGKRISDASFAVLYLKEQVEEIVTVQRYQNAVTPMRGSSFVIGRLDNLTSGSNLKNIRKNKELFLHRAPGRNNDLILPKTTTLSSPEDNTPEFDDDGNRKEGQKVFNGVLISKELNPPRLAFTLVESFSQIQTVLDYFLAKDDAITLTEITDILYEVDHSKKTPVCNLRKSITAATRALAVDVKYNFANKEGVETLSLTLAVDLMNRNDLSAIASRHPKVWAVTWQESNQAFRYGTIIEAGGDIGIWTGVYSNIRLLPK